MNPKVSIVIPSYNRASVLPRAIKSVFAQTFHDFEIIVVDDCSTDDTANVVPSFFDSRIRYIRHEQNKGGNAARNTGINAAKGEFVAFLDSDDVWLPEKLQKQLAVFVKPEIGLVYCGLIFMVPGIGEINRWFVKCGPDFREDLLVSNYIGTTSVAVVRTELLKKINGFDESLRSCQDWDLYLRLKETCDFGYAEEFLVHYQINRKSRTQISTDPEAVLSGQDAIQRKYSRQIAQLPRKKKIARIDYLLMIFVGMAHLRGVYWGWKGFALSGNPKYFFIIIKIIVKSFVRKLGLK